MKSCLINFGIFYQEALANKCSCYSMFPYSRSLHVQHFLPGQCYLKQSSQWPRAQKGIAGPHEWTQWGLDQHRDLLVHADGSEWLTFITTFWTPFVLKLEAFYVNWRCFCCCVRHFTIDNCWTQTSIPALVCVPVSTVSIKWDRREPESIYSLLSVNTFSYN